MAVTAVAAIVPALRSHLRRSGKSPILRLPRALKPDGRYVLIGHERFGASGKRVFGLVPHFLKLIFLARFVKQLRGPGIPMLTKQRQWPS